MDSTGTMISIRRMTVDDAEAVCSIYARITKEFVGDDFKHLVQEHAKKGEADACYVAEDDGKVVGFMISYLLPFGFGIERSAWISTVGVDPKYMGQGIGGRLAKAILTFYQEQGVRHVHTSVLWDSTDLLSFFKSLGFDRSEFINLSKTLM